MGLVRLRRDCVEAKEALSTDVDTLVPVALPGLSTTVRLTRAEFELMVRPALNETMAAMGRALRNAHVEPTQLRSILLVGGSSRIPLVSEMLHREFSVPTALDSHPKHDVALGSVRVGHDETDTIVGMTGQPAPPTRSEPAAPRVTTAAAPLRGRRSGRRSGGRCLHAGIRGADPRGGGRSAGRRPPVPGVRRRRRPAARWRRKPLRLGPHRRPAHHAAIGPDRRAPAPAADRR